MGRRWTESGTRDGDQGLEQEVLCFRAAAEQGEPNAQANLGTLHYTGGGGLKRDESMAAAWWRKAALLGHTKAQLNLGVLLLDRRRRIKQEMERNRKNVKSYEQENAISPGFAFASSAREERICGDKEGPNNSDLLLVEAAGWLRKAAEQGDKTALRCLRVLLSDPADSRAS